MDFAGRQSIQYRLRKFRKIAGLKQETVRRKLNLKSRGVVSRWENGKAEPSLSQLRELAKLYQCRPVDLYPDLLAIPLSDKKAGVSEFQDEE